jgi:hypothetical protein
VNGLERERNMVMGQNTRIIDDKGEATLGTKRFSAATTKKKEGRRPDW